MRTRWMGALAMATALFPAALAAQQPGVTECQPGTGAAARTPGAGPTGQLAEYDVVVDVPDLCVEFIRLNVMGVDARLSLNVRVANLVRVQAGADVHLGEVDLGIRGVRAQALLLVDLDNVVYVVDRALTFIDENPEIVSQLVGTVGNAVGTLGGVAETALQPGGVVSQTVGVAGRTLDNVTAPGGLLSQTVNTLGQTVQRTVDQTGNIVERTLDTAGNVVNTRTVGSLLRMRTLRQSTNSAGQTVRQVRDESGAVIEYIFENGRVVSTRVVRPGGEQ